MQAARGASLNPSDEDQTPDSPPDPAVPSRSRLIVLFAAVAASLYALDVLGKVWAVRQLTPGETVDLVGPYFTLHLIRNPGAAFSTGTAYTEVLSVLSVIAIGVVTLLAGQTFINLLVATRLMPVTGITLPFVSYGGSSLLASFIAVGLLLNIGQNRPLVIARESFEY